MTKPAKLTPLFRPLRDGVLIQRDDDNPYGGASRIIVLSKPEVKGLGTVVAVGAGAWVRRRKVDQGIATVQEAATARVRGSEAATSAVRIPMTVKVGDRVVWDPIEGMEFFTLDGKCQVLLAEHHLTIIEDDKAVEDDTAAA